MDAAAALDSEELTAVMGGIALRPTLPALGELTAHVLHHCSQLVCGLGVLAQERRQPTLPGPDQVPADVV
ncbi:hypothetical protein [Streptomyces sp. SLBN-118]|uniref:hypothetical protein n=1 Tax=Streptomyces sp. SLBN-118 TaxID=2768454 RepID=UPI001151D684|nr:hypothetical protein [Streptomyces sp. SLBN-118]